MLNNALIAWQCNLKSYFFKRNRACVAISAAEGQLDDTHCLFCAEYVCKTPDYIILKSPFRVLDHDVFDMFWQKLRPARFRSLQSAESVQRTDGEPNIALQGCWAINYADQCADVVTLEKHASDFARECRLSGFNQRIKTLPNHLPLGLCAGVGR